MWFLQDLSLNRVEIDEGGDAEAHMSGARPKRKRKTYDLNTSDSFWVAQKGR